MTQFLSAAVVGSDPNSREVLTPTGQRLGFLKLERGVWRFLPSHGDARLTIELLEEIVGLLKVDDL